MKSKGYMTVTVPRYTPEFNPIEKLFSMIKRRFVKTDFKTNQLYQ